MYSFRTGVHFRTLVRFWVSSHLYIRTIFRLFVCLFIGRFCRFGKCIEDNEFGRFLIKVNTRARRLTFRTREDAIYVTIPPGTTLKEIKNAIEELRPRLRVARKNRLVL